MTSSSSSSEGNVVVQLLDPVEIESSSGDPPMSEWSSLIIEKPEENVKRAFFAQGLYTPGSSEVCGKYIPMSDSSVFRHPYFNYPAVLDPGIVEALQGSQEPRLFPDDGQDLYKILCKEVNTCPVRIFHRGLLNKEINLSYYGVDANAIRPMAVALQHNKNVHTLNLTDNFLNDDACYHLAQVLATNSTINTLILAGCRIGASGILRLGSTLAENRSLKEIDLSRNCLGEDGGVNFAKQIEKGAGVARISLSNNQLGRLTATALAEALEYRNNVAHLDLSWNSFFHTPSTVKMLEQLTNSETLQELDLSWNALEGNRVASAIKELLDNVLTLKVLILGNNRLKDEAITIIAGGLMRAKKLSVLNLSYNPLSTADANVMLVQMLQPRVKLETLLLEGVPVQKKFPQLLERVMEMKSRKNFSIKYGRVLSNWIVQGPDPRKLVLERAKFLGTKEKKHRVDVALYFLGLAKEFTKPIPVKMLIDRIALDAVPLDEDLIVEMAVLFSGAKTAKSKTVDVLAICDYINRIWPEKKLPPTPPPEPEPEPMTATTPDTKEKKGKKK